MTGTFVVGTLPLPRLLPRFGVVAALLALTVGCGGSSTTASTSSNPGAGGAGSSTVLRAATLRPGQPVPLPEGKPILTVTGKVSAKNQGSAIALGREGLDQLGLVQVRVYAAPISPMRPDSSAIGMNTAAGSPMTHPGGWPVTSAHYALQPIGPSTWAWPETPATADQACGWPMFTIQAMPNWSTHMPNSSPHICFSRGTDTVPPSDSFSQ